MIFSKLCSLLTMSFLFCLKLDFSVLLIESTLSHSSSLVIIKTEVVADHDIDIDRSWLDV